MQATDRQDSWRSDFSPVAGGPLFELLQRARLVRECQLCTVRASLLQAVVALGPLLLLAALERAGTGRLDPMLSDLSVYARFIVAVPLILVAERSMHVRCMRTIERFARGTFALDEQMTALERSLRRAMRLRDLRTVEIVLLVLAVLGGQAALWGVAGSAGYVESARVGRVTVAQIWYSLVALPFFQFMLARWLWRWALWSRVLWDISRLRLQLVPTHPDHAGGIRLLSDPTFAFAWFASGASSVLASAWATRLLRGDTELSALALPFSFVAVTAALVVYGPLLIFVPLMVRQRFEGIRSYGRVALAHSRLFHRRWVEGEIDDSLLGSPDISSLADLTTAYESLEKMRVVPFGPRSVAAVAIGLVTPMLPLVAIHIPVPELLLRIGKTLFLGLPA